MEFYRDTKCINDCLTCFFVSNISHTHTFQPSQPHLHGIIFINYYFSFTPVHLWQMFCIWSLYIMFL